MAAPPSLESIAAAVGVIQKEYASSKNVGFLWFFAVSALVLGIVAMITLFASVFPLNIKALNVGKSVSGSTTTDGGVVISGIATVNALNVGPTINKGGPAKNPGDIVAGGNIWVGTGDASGTGAVLLGANVNAQSIYASGGPNNQVVSKFNGPTVITNAAIAGGIVDYKGANPAASLSM